MKKAVLLGIILSIAACDEEAPSTTTPVPDVLIEPVRPSEALPLIEPGTCKAGVWICNDDADTTTAKRPPVIP